VDVTVWTDRTELFMEYPPLVAGAQVRFAIHLTDLADFSPVREGRVVVRFEGETIERFEVEGPSTPGIFGVDVTVPAARRYQLAVELHGARLSDEHRVGAVTVYPTAEEAIAAIGEDEEGATAFLKEQQWTLDFATAVVDDRARREVLVGARHHRAAYRWQRRGTCAGGRAPRGRWRPCRGHASESRRSPRRADRPGPSGSAKHRSSSWSCRTPRRSSDWPHSRWRASSGWQPQELFLRAAWTKRGRPKRAPRRAWRSPGSSCGTWR
jgi:hypothetical protein